MKSPCGAEKPSLIYSRSKGRGTKYRQSWTWPNRGHAYEVLKCLHLRYLNIFLCPMSKEIKKTKQENKVVFLYMKFRAIYSPLLLCYYWQNYTTVSNTDLYSDLSYVFPRHNDSVQRGLIINVDYNKLNFGILLSFLAWNFMSVPEFLCTLSPWITNQQHHRLPQWLLAGKASLHTVTLRIKRVGREFWSVL